MASNDRQFKSPPTRFEPMSLAIGPAIVVSGSVIGAGRSGTGNSVFSGTSLWF